MLNLFVFSEALLFIGLNDHLLLTRFFFSSDLAQKATGLTQEDLAGWLFDSLRNKLMVLPDDVIVYPAHGAGSACGKNMSSETSDTLGNQKKTNYALSTDLTRDAFIAEVCDGLMPPPQYFSKNAELNKKGYDQIDQVMQRGLKALSIEDFANIQNDNDVLILDVRDKWEFVKGHIPGSIFIGLDGSFAPWVGALITNLNQKLAIVSAEGREEETIKRLARVGYDQPVGYLKGSFAAWKKAGKLIAEIPTLTMEEFLKAYKNNPERQIIDVRKPGEYETTHACSAQLLSLDYFSQNNYESLDKNSPYYLHCRSGYRSTVAASIMQKYGFTDIIDVIGSFDLIKEHLEVEGTCPSLLV